MISMLKKASSQHSSPNPSPAPSPCTSPQVPVRSYTRQAEPKKKPAPEIPYKAPVISIQPEPQKVSKAEPEKSFQPEPELAKPGEFANLAMKLSQVNLNPCFEDFPTPKEEDEVSCKATDIDDEVARLRAKRAMVWAEQLMNHKELTTADKIGLPKFFKTREEVSHLENELFDLAANSDDVSLITVTSELIGQIETLFADYPL